MVIDHPSGKGAQPIGKAHDVADDSQTQVPQGELFLQKKEHSGKDQKVPMGEPVGAPRETDDHFLFTIHTFLPPCSIQASFQFSNLSGDFFQLIFFTGYGEFPF
jgi:hypothetical protein